jgi:sulfur relay (sulfurtransferase) DsrC/TusE family protein
MKKLGKILVMLALLPAMAFAQGRGPGHGKMSPEVKAQLDQLRKDTYTRVLSLSDAEAQKFWPVFDKMQEEIKAVRKDAQSVRKDIKNNSATLSDADMDKKINQLLDDEQKLLNIKRNYYAEFKKVLPIKKVALLPEAEREFKKALLDKIKENGDGGDNSGGGD